MLLSWKKDFEISSTLRTIILGDRARGGNLGDPDTGSASEASSSVCFMTEGLLIWCLEGAEDFGSDKLEWVEWVSEEIDLPSSDNLEDSEDG